MAEMRDTLPSQWLVRCILADAPNILHHYEVMQQFAEQVKKTRKIADAHRALWDMYISLAVATSFTHYVPLVPYEGGSAEVQDITTKGEVEESGMLEGEHNGNHLCH
ncbi:hypothetical protein A0H81_07737 [Grifola frondosa]|uniref:Uncharacterized protein n=1 Tax=Grifola frondosa TaxID=5627 RepID=A0A1C7M5X4_GRIFR|nr:hypothetical protein A0H81_07737 [Grifola frondosa]